VSELVNLRPSPAMDLHPHATTVSMKKEGEKPRAANRAASSGRCPSRSASIAVVGSRHRRAEGKNEAEQGAGPPSLDSLSSVAEVDPGRRQQSSRRAPSSSRALGPTTVTAPGRPAVPDLLFFGALSTSAAACVSEAQ
jgi:hypothetical protein